jgi:hypothetical protein
VACEVKDCGRGGVFCGAKTVLKMGSSNLKERTMAGQASHFGTDVCCHNVLKMSMSGVGATTGLLGGADCPVLGERVDLGMLVVVTQQPDF